MVKALNRNASVISHELRRNRGQRDYRAKQVQRKTSDKRKNPRTMKMTSEVVKYAEKKLSKEWSPEEISGRIEREIETNVSYECIYQHVWMNKTQGGLVLKSLHFRKKNRWKRCEVGNLCGKIPN